MLFRSGEQQTAITDMWMGVCMCLPVPVCIRHCSGSVSVFLHRSKTVWRTVRGVSIRLVNGQCRARAYRIKFNLIIILFNLINY